MASRGAVARDGHVTTSEFVPIRKIHDATVVKAIHGHNFPDYSHTPNSIYIRELDDGSFRELRVYGENGKAILEIAYHGEKSITGNATTKVLHYHLFDSELNRTEAELLTDELKEQYKKYLKEYGL